MELHRLMSDRCLYCADTHAFPEFASAGSGFGIWQSGCTRPTHRSSQRLRLSSHATRDNLALTAAIHAELEALAPWIGLSTVEITSNW